MSRPSLEAIARALDEAWLEAAPIPAPSLTEPSLTRADAYSIQDLLIDRRLQRGRFRTGWKLGLTSANPPVTPIAGILLDDMVVESGVDLALPTMVAPMVEAEFVVRIGETIERPLTVAELEHGPHEVGPGIEVIDYRTTGSAGVIDWIADNSTVAYAVVGPLVPIADVMRPQVGVTLSRNGENLARGMGSQVMGDPVAAVSWLTGHVVSRGQRLAEGDVILTGSLTGHHRVTPDDVSVFEADFAELGRVQVQFHP